MECLEVGCSSLPLVGEQRGKRCRGCRGLSTPGQAWFIPCTCRFMARGVHCGIPHTLRLAHRGEACTHQAAAYTCMATPRASGSHWRGLPASRAEAMDETCGFVCTCTWCISSPLRLRPCLCCPAPGRLHASVLFPLERLALRLLGLRERRELIQRPYGTPTFLNGMTPGMPGDGIHRDPCEEDGCNRHPRASSRAGWGCPRLLTGMLPGHGMAPATSETERGNEIRPSLHGRACITRGERAMAAAPCTLWTAVDAATARDMNVPGALPCRACAQRGAGRTWRVLHVVHDGEGDHLCPFCERVCSLRYLCIACSSERRRRHLGAAAAVAREGKEEEEEIRLAPHARALLPVAC